MFGDSKKSSSKQDDDKDKVNLVIPILALVIGLLNVVLLLLANLDKIVAVVG